MSRDSAPEVAYVVGVRTSTTIARAGRARRARFDGLCLGCLRSFIFYYLCVAHSRGRAALVALVAEPARLSPAVRCAIFPSQGRRSGFDQSWHGSAERRPAICAAQQAQCTHSDGCGIALAERN